MVTTTRNVVTIAPLIDWVSESDKKGKEEIPESPQALIGFMTNDEWDQLLDYVNAMISEMEALPLPDVKDKVFELLAGIDSIHRESIHRLVRLFKKGVLEQVITDPPIRTLMQLYDIVPTPDPSEVGTFKPNFPNIPIKVTQSAAPESNPQYPHWVPALKHRDELRPGNVVEVLLDDYPVLLCRVEDAFFALASGCAQDGSSLREATLSRFTLSCPSHPGCLYDVRQGTRIGASAGVECYPVKITDDGPVMVGLDMDFVADLPTF